MTDVKLLSEADVESLYKRIIGGGIKAFKSVLQEQGVIPPEPVDPLLIEAREIAAVHGDWIDPEVYQPRVRAGEWDKNHRVQIALVALKRGMELQREAQPALTPARFPVPEGQTPLDDNLHHRLLEVIREGRNAFDGGAANPYHGHSLEHGLHATGWVQRDLRVALDKAQARIAALTNPPHAGKGVE